MFAFSSERVLGGIVQYLWTLMLALIFAWSGEALASLPTLPSQPTITSNERSLAMVRAPFL